MNILTVTQLNRYISFKLKEDSNLRGIFLKGEISNFRNSGHLYFTIKDNESLIKAVMFRNNASMLRFVPENGMNVIAMGTVSVFERDGAYQLYVSDMQPDGTGNQHILFEKLKKELEKEGLFDVSHKLPIPEFPKKIGVVTSDKGAALQDIINIIKRRYPIGELSVYHSAVQGEGAALSVCSALKKAQSEFCDVVILGRGGGSSEDLSAFNDKQLANCIYNMTVPVISAVGHETDFTIADFVADLRAPTPSAAAELAVPSVQMLYDRIYMLSEKMRKAFEILVRRKDERLSDMISRLHFASPELSLQRNISQLDAYSQRFYQSYKNIILRYDSDLSGMITRLEALNPLSVLSRGYSVVYKNDKIIKSVDQLNNGDTVSIKMSDGTAYAEISETEK